MFSEDSTEIEPGSSPQARELNEVAPYMKKL